MTGDVGAPPSPIDGEWSHSDQPAIASCRGDLFPGTSGNVENPESSDTGLTAIAAHDPAFSRQAFLGAVQTVFFVVEGAWTQRQPEVSRQVMADALWQQHRVQIQGYLDAHRRNVLGDLSVLSLTVIAAHSDASYDTITVRVLAVSSDYDVDDSSGKIVRGDKRVQQWMEDWTFQRSSSAKTPAGGGTLSSRCPNCGAPLEVDLTGQCKYCKALVSS
ncbi:MAG TPA: TIM44-like domain-containing protein, partial [Acidimicrobiales bacterium]|nr:TIM44-like domain-containing protein [Acidimicrobiales bacterium]